MKTALQLFTDSNVPVAKKIRDDAEWKVEAVDLTRKDVDYRELLQKIFAADSVQVW
jgi:hypothetical protein